MTRIVVLAGQAGHGKSTVCEVFTEHGFERAPLAGPLKDMLETVLALRGVGHDERSAMLWGGRKEMPHAALEGKTTRHAMQTLGTEWGRKLIGENFWLDTWRDRWAETSLVLVDDARFANEGAYLKALGAELYVVRRPGFTKNVAAHASEDLAWAAGEEVIWNDGYPTAGDFQDSVRARFFA